MSAGRVVCRLTGRRRSLLAAVVGGAAALLCLTGWTAAALAAKARADLSAALSCPKSVKLNQDLKCALRVSNVGNAAASSVLAILRLPSDGQLVATRIDGGSGKCSLDGAQMLCSINSVPSGHVVTVRGEGAFELPYGARPGTHSAVKQVSGSADEATDPTPADNHDQASFKLLYPETTKAIPASGHHPKAGAATATRVFCGIESATGNLWSRAWCVDGISSSRNGGKWGNGWVHARLISGTRYLYPPNRNRQLEYDVREQVRANTAYGGVSWETVQDLSYPSNSFWEPQNPGLGNNPYLRWRWRYFGSQGTAWAADGFSLQQDGELYRVQARFKFFDKRFGFFITEGDSGWYSIRYVQSGLGGW